MNIQTRYARAIRAREHFVKLIKPLRNVAHASGYGLAHYGSLSRDLDFVAIPLLSQVVSPQKLFERILEACRDYNNGQAELTPGKEKEFPRKMHHGRLQWSIWLDDLVYIDFSVMPSLSESHVENINGVH